jgi:molecular chaperone IbpA
MTKITTLDLSPFYRNSIGVDRLFDRLMGQIDAGGTTQNYPPYNIVKTGDNTYEIQVAVAGFTQGDVTVNVNEGNLIITGEKLSTDLPEGHVYEHQGISARRFIRTFTLADYVEVTSAISRDGILTVELERQVPEAMKPKTIAISYKS